MENTNVVEKKEPKTTKEKVIFGLKIAGNVIFYSIIIFLFVFSIMNINSGGKGGIPNIFGKGYLTIQSESMERLPNGRMLEQWDDYEIKEINKGDLITVDIFNKKDAKKLKLGDVITFVDPKLDNSLNTHRIVYINLEEDYVITQGDLKAQQSAFIIEDPFGANASHNYGLESSGAVEHVEISNIKAVVTGVNRGMGSFIDTITSERNWLLIFVLPVAIVLLVEIFIVVKNIMDLKGEKQKAELATDKEAMMAELEAEKERMRQELLAELRASQGVVEEPKVEEVKEEVVEAEVVETPAETADAVEETTEVVEESEPEVVEEAAEEVKKEVQE